MVHGLRQFLHLRFRHWFCQHFRGRHTARSTRRISHCCAGRRNGHNLDMMRVCGLVLVALMVGCGASSDGSSDVSPETTGGNVTEATGGAAGASEDTGGTTSEDTATGGAQAMATSTIAATGGKISTGGATSAGGTKATGGSWSTIEPPTGGRRSTGGANGAPCQKSTGVSIESLNCYCPTAGSCCWLGSTGCKCGQYYSLSQYSDIACETGMCKGGICQ